MTGWYFPEPIGTKLSIFPKSPFPSTEYVIFPAANPNSRSLWTSHTVEPAHKVGTNVGSDVTLYVEFATVKYPVVTLAQISYVTHATGITSNVSEM